MDELISRQAAIDIIEDFPHGDVWNVESMEEMVDRIKQLPPIQSKLLQPWEVLAAQAILSQPAEPKRETATVSVGKSKGGVTMWYECAACGEPVDQGDTFCSGCGRRLIHE